MFHQLKANDGRGLASLSGVSNFEALIWRVGLGLSFAVTVVRLALPESAIPDAFWSAGQFVPLLASGASALLLAKTVRFGLVGWALTSAAVLALLSSFWSVAPGVSAQQGAVLLGVFAFLIATSSSRWLDRSALRGDFRFIFYVMSICMILGGIIWLVAPAGVMGYFGRYQGIFPNPNYAALLASVGLPIGVWIVLSDRRRAQRAAAAIGILALTITLYYTGSRGAAAGAILGVVVSLLVSRYRKIALWTIAAAFAGVAAFVAIFPEKFFGRGGYLDRSDQGSDISSGRFEIWAELLRIWEQRPVLGTGYRTIELLPSSDGFTAHNIYLSILVELGAIGLLIFLGVFAVLLVGGVRASTATDRILVGAVVAILVGELLEASLFGFGGPTAVISWVVIVAFASFSAAAFEGRLGSPNPLARPWGRRTREAISARDALSHPEAPTPNVSVCMATYNGSAYVKAQVDSILSQLDHDDELVIVDDASTDDTVQVLRRILDPRIRLIVLDENVRHVRAFERALSEARGDYLFLSDQDDIWVEGRLSHMLAELQSSRVVASNWRLIGGNAHTSPKFVDEEASSRSKFSNLLLIYRGRLPYFGCAMGIRRDALSLVLPFPRATEAHDLWIAIAGNVDGGISHLGGVTVERRIHGNNLTPLSRRSWRRILKSRVGMMLLTLTAYKRDALRTLRRAP
ncbi:glycosyltransferase [Conyzicola sp.]|uniref:glycosyltransferase n=1 Tax=Conyzicola sp. TaxID=1969404 RepID=UPI003988CB3B